MINTRRNKFAISKPGMTAIAISIAIVGAVSPASHSIAKAVEKPNYAVSVPNNIAAQDAIEKYAQEINDDPSFGGVGIVASGVMVHVVGRPSSAVQASIANISKTVPVTTQDVTFSLLSLRALTKELDEAAPELTKNGIEMSSWGPHLQTNRVEVALTHYSDSARDALIAKYGSEELVVLNKSETIEPSTRFTDTSPFRGGNGINKTGSSPVCTSWFGVVSATSTAQYVMTAGHCSSGTWKVSSGGSLGATVALHFGGTVDGQTFYEHNETTVWSDPTSTYRTVTGVSTANPYGGLVCTNGMVDKEVCNVQIDNEFSSATYYGVQVTDVVRALQLSGNAAFSKGDSGGPVYTSLNSTGLNARGMLAARVMGGNDNAEGYYTKVANIQSAFNVKVRIG